MVLVMGGHSTRPEGGTRKADRPGHKSSCDYPQSWQRTGSSTPAVPHQEPRAWVLGTLTGTPCPCPCCRACLQSTTATTEVEAEHAGVKTPKFWHRD